MGKIFENTTFPAKQISQVGADVHFLVALADRTSLMSGAKKIHTHFLMIIIVTVFMMRLVSWSNKPNHTEQRSIRSRVKLGPTSNAFKQAALLSAEIKRKPTYLRMNIPARFRQKSGCLYYKFAMASTGSKNGESLKKSAYREFNCAFPVV